MKKYITTLILTCLLFTAEAQAPLVRKWDKRFGGDNGDGLRVLRQTADGGYILGGGSASDRNGDKTQPLHGFIDFWVVKIDSAGNKQWDKGFGGTDQEGINAMQQTSDGGYILAGTTLSGIDGDKTSPAWGGMDIWVVKIDAQGNEEWEQAFGGTNTEITGAVLQTADGGYLIGGLSQSDVSGNKASPSLGNMDFWIVKTDAQGNKLWDKTFGSSGTDQFVSMLPVADGGYLLAGNIGSGINGDITQPSRGLNDYWIVKIDSLGNKQWDKRFGGAGYEQLAVVQSTTHGGYILGGVSDSGIGGDKSEPVQGGYDYWIVKVDSLGNMEWEKNLGGTGDEVFFSVQVAQTDDGGFLVNGQSDSPAGGDKSENNLGVKQMWMVKTDSAGNKQWDRTILTNTLEEVEGTVLLVNETCYLLGNSSAAGTGGDRTQPNWDTMRIHPTADYWIIKFCDTTGLNCNLAISSVSVTAHVSCMGAGDGAAKVVATGGIAPYNFLWSDGQTTATPTELFAGTYTVTVTDVNGCAASTAAIIEDGLQPCTAIHENALNTISLYPNPTNNTITIASTAILGNITLRIFDALGRVMLQQALPPHGLKDGVFLDLRHQEQGIYFLNIVTTTGSRMLKVMKY